MLGQAKTKSLPVAFSSLPWKEVSLYPRKKKVSLAVSP